MSNELSPELRSQIFRQQSDDPFLTLLTLSGPGFIFRLANNTVDITSRGQIFQAFPFKLRLPTDDGESAREFEIEIDNASLLLLSSLRAITRPVDCKIEMVLASIPDTVQMSMDELLVRSVIYDSRKITAKIVMDNFLAVAMTSERYTPSLYPGMF